VQEDVVALQVAVDDVLGVQVAETRRIHFRVSQTGKLDPTGGGGRGELASRLKYLPIKDEIYFYGDQ
jgi:hypothetical protein